VVAAVGTFSALAGGLALAFIMYPIVVRSADEILRLVPQAHVEAALALGSPRWRTTWSVVLPAAAPGLLTGVMIAIARVSGETAPLLFTAGGAQFFSSGLLEPITALPVYIFNGTINRIRLSRSRRDGPDHRGHRPFGERRLCIARALAVEPDVLLMDEPCSALDPQSTYRIEDLIDELKLRLTIVIVTHNMQQAARVSDFTAFVTIENEGEPGRLVESGPTRRLFTSPRHERTEAYVSGRFG
jgi:hypothetical protein